MSFVSGPIPFNGAALAEELSSVYPAFSKQSGYTSDCIFGSTGTYILCTNSSDAGVYQHSGTPASADYSVFADIAHPNSNSTNPYIGVIGRAAAATTTFYLVYYDNANTRFSLYRVNSGSATQLGSHYTYTLTSTVVNLELRMSGSDISVHLDGGSAVISATDGSPITAAGKAGIYCLAMRQSGVSDSGSLDNFDAIDAGGGGSSYTPLTGGLTRGILTKGRLIS